MRNRTLLPMVAMVLAMAAAGAPAGAQLGEFVQARVDAEIQEGQFCRAKVLYTVPAGKRLRIEWISIEGREFGDGFEPLDVSVRTKVSGPAVVHPLARIEDAVMIGEAISVSAFWNSPVTIYASAGSPVTVIACRSSSTDGTSVLVTMQGQLFDE